VQVPRATERTLFANGVCRAASSPIGTWGQVLGPRLVLACRSANLAIVDPLFVHHFCEAAPFGSDGRISKASLLRSTSAGQVCLSKADAATQPDREQRNE